MSKSASDFIMSQIRNVNRPKPGRRFTDDDKIFALNIFKAGPRAYKLLRMTFSLPSKKVLLQMLRKIPFRTGINKNLFAALKNTLLKMEDLDKYCYLVFDEVHLSTQITYNASEDRFIGFKEDGSDSVPQIADHALVFMVRGLRKQWKQPIAYYFVHKTISSAQLSCLIKGLIVECRLVGLHVLATLSDQGSTNRGAINLLLKDTDRICIERRIENRFFGYLVGDLEVVHLYDPPHLLKCVRNCLLEHNIQFQWKNETKTAKWADIVQYYKFDKGDDDIRLTPKIMDGHVYKQKMNKMKVSVAAQIFSQRLSAVMRKFSGCCKLKPFYSFFY